MTRITEPLLLQLAPRARASYLEAFTREDVLLASGILATPLRLAHFLAQVCHESDGLTVLVENLNYGAERLVKVWPRRFPDVAAAAPYVGNPRALANHVYVGRNGNTAPDDGYRYIGRGLLQLTGRANYARVGEAIGVDLVAHPYLAASAEHSLRVALEIWRSAGCMPLADADDLLRVTRAINGGLNGLENRRDWLVKAKAVLATEELP